MKPSPLIRRYRGWSRIARRNAAIALIVALSALLAAYQISVQIGIRDLKQQGNQRAAAVISAIFLPVEKFRLLPRVLASHPINQSALSVPENAEQVQTADQYLLEMNQMIGAEVIYLMDLNGRTVASSNWNEKNSFIGQNFRYRPYFMDAVSGVDGRFYGVGTVSRTPGYFMSSPVFSRAGIAGVIAMKINLSRIDKEWQTDRNYDVTVADEYGIIFLSSKPDWKYRPSRRLTKEEQNTLKLTRKYDRLERSPMQISDQSIAFGPNAIREVTTVDVHGDVEKTRYVVIRKKICRDRLDGIYFYSSRSGSCARATQHIGYLLRFGVSFPGRFVLAGAA